MVTVKFKGHYLGAAVIPLVRNIAPRCAQAEDELLAFLLINTRTLTTGRILRSDVPPNRLSEDELIEFWCDEHMTGDDISDPVVLPEGWHRW